MVNGPTEPRDPTTVSPWPECSARTTSFMAGFDSDAHVGATGKGDRLRVSRWPGVARVLHSAVAGLGPPLATARRRAVCLRDLGSGGGPCAVSYPAGHSG